MIPNICDGFKISQRKAVWAALKKGAIGPKREEKVAQLAAYVASETNYHHGEGSLESVIVGLAQNWPGSNNVNYFYPNGQFGNRLSPTPAASRYIYTYLTEDFRKIFREEDDCLLEFNMSEGQPVEPKYFLPIIPNILLNGAEGIGTGYAVKILPHRASDLARAIVKILDDQEPGQLTPWFRGFRGQVQKVKTEDGWQTITRGVYDAVHTTKIEIDELPIGLYLDDYKEVLGRLMDNDSIKSYDDYSTEEKFKFTVNAPRTTTGVDKEKFDKMFKMVQRSSENYTVWNERGYIQVFKSAEDLLKTWVKWRVVMYEKRIHRQIEKKTADIHALEERIRFVDFYLKNSDQFKQKNKEQLKTYLQANKFEDWEKHLGMRIWTLTGEEIVSSQLKLREENTELAKLQSSTAVAVWKSELKSLRQD